MQNTIDKLIEEKVASRLFDQDATLYDFNENALDFAKNFMGWTDLASKPPTKVSEIASFAHKCRKQGLDAVYLIGMGGSSQAPMTVTKFNKVCGEDGSFGANAGSGGAGGASRGSGGAGGSGNSRAGMSAAGASAIAAGMSSTGVKFRVLDSTSPVRIRRALGGETFENALVVVSSKSGGTLEPRMILSAVRDIMALHLDVADIPKHLVAITDPGSDLEKQAEAEGWKKTFTGKPSVGGRFSALSVFGLVPAALAGVDVEKFVARAKKAESECSKDNDGNPAIKLASFLYDNYEDGRDKFCYIAPKSGRTFGLWIEQLVAESLGKGACGILPCLEVNLSLQADDEAFVVPEPPKSAGAGGGAGAGAGAGVEGAAGDAKDGGTGGGASDAKDGASDNAKSGAAGKNGAGGKGKKNAKGGKDANAAGAEKDGARNAGNSAAATTTGAAATSTSLATTGVSADAAGNAGSANVQPNNLKDRTFVVYETPCPTRDDELDFEENLRALSHSVPRKDFKINDLYDLAKHFVVWEYAVAMCGRLMGVCPFDQPDVQSAKTQVMGIIEKGLPNSQFAGEITEINVSPVLGFTLPEEAMGALLGSGAQVRGGAGAHSLQNLNDAQVELVLRDILASLITSIAIGDYFAINAFLPFTGDERVRALEHMRQAIARMTGVVSILEVGPRFLHSSGQLHKGGPNTGVFLVISGDELEDIKVNEPCKTMGNLAKAQAMGDWQVLAQRDRRAVHVHLKNNSSAALWKLAHILDDALDSVMIAALS